MAASRASLQQPQYRQVADTLRRRIRNGVYQQGETIPSFVELEDLFDVSSITVRKAVGILSDEGLVDGRRGIGTVVIANRPDERVTIEVSGDFGEWLDSAKGKRWPVEQELLGIDTGKAPPTVARSLGLPGDDVLWCMRRLRRIAGAPISYHVNYGRPQVLGRIKAPMMANQGSFVDAMRRHCALPLARMDQRVEAITADRDLAGLLEVDFGEPLFFVENLYSDESAAPLAVTHLYLRGDRYAYQASITLEDEVV
jgi:DNA-binding GntR family transcriptional regulator